MLWPLLQHASLQLNRKNSKNIGAGDISELEKIEVDGTEGRIVSQEHGGNRRRKEGGGEGKQEVRKGQEPGKRGRDCR